MAETHREPRLVGYARISTYGQTLDNQINQLRAAGCSSRNIYREKVTGARPERRELLHMLDRLAPGDVVTVTRIDRLATQHPRPVWHRQAHRGREGAIPVTGGTVGPTPAPAPGGCCIFLAKAKDFDKFERPGIKGLRLP